MFPALRSHKGCMQTHPPCESFFHLQGALWVSHKSQTSPMLINQSVVLQNVEQQQSLLLTICSQEWRPSLQVPTGLLAQNVSISWTMCNAWPTSAGRPGQAWRDGQTQVYDLLYIHNRGTSSCRRGSGHSTIPPASECTSHKYRHLGKAMISLKLSASSLISLKLSVRSVPGGSQASRRS